MQPSPYTPGQVARQVPGRDEQLADIDEQLSLMADLGQFVGRIRIDAAPRGMGKTSILAQVAQLAERRGAATIWVAGGTGPSLIGSIAERVDRLVAGWDGDTPPERTRHRRLRRALQRLTLKLTLGVPGIAQVEADLAPATANPTEGSATSGRAGRSDPTLEFEELVRETVAAAVAERRTGLVLLIDEIQSADAQGLSTLAHTWQNLQRDPGGDAGGAPIRAAVFAAGTPDAEDVLRAAASFSERFHYPLLGPLSDQAVRSALVTPARDRGVTWDAVGLERAVAFCEGFPFTVQLVGDGAWRAAGRPDPGAVIGEQHVAAAIESANQELRRLHRARWNAATPAERRLLQAMASLPGPSVARAEVAALLGVSSVSISELRDRLITKGVIRSTGRGTLGFTINGMDSYVRELDAAEPGPA